MSGDKFDKELSALYQQRKQQVAAPEVDLKSHQEKAGLQRSPLSMLLLLFAGGAASFGVMAIVNYFAEPSVHGDMGQFKQHSVRIVELAPVVPEDNTILTTPPLPPKPDSTAALKTSAPEKLAEQVAVAKPNIELNNTLSSELNVPDIHQPFLPPTPVHKVMPEYPKSAVYSRQSGTVKLAYRINPYGEVVDIISFNDRSHRVLEKSAKQALAKWQFSPDAHSNKTLEVTFEFNLEGVKN